MALLLITFLAPKASALLMSPHLPHKLVGLVWALSCFSHVFSLRPCCCSTAHTFRGCKIILSVTQANSNLGFR